jgi:hypothetical protein
MTPISNRRPVNQKIIETITSVAQEMNADIALYKDEGDEYSAAILMEHRDRLLDAIGE